MEAIQEYYKNALLADLCTEYKGLWQAASKDKRKLVDLALSMQAIPHLLTFAHEGNGMTKESLMNDFGDYINGRYTAMDVDGVKGGYKSELYVGYNGILSHADDVLCIMWSTIPLMEIKATKAVKIYVGCSSDVRIVCGGYNNVTIMLFDDSKVTLSDIDEESNVTVFKYSDQCDVTIGKYCMGKVKEFRKELRL